MSNWRRRKYDAPGMSQAPPGPYLAAVARRWTRKIYVTSPGWDNIGEVLKSMGVAFEPFAGEHRVTGHGSALSGFAVRSTVNGMAALTGPAGRSISLPRTRRVISASVSNRP